MADKTASSPQETQSKKSQDVPVKKPQEAHANEPQEAKGNGPEKTRAAGEQPNGPGTGRDELPVFLPPADIFENKNEVLLILDVPGAEPDSFDVTLDRRVLSVSARSTPWIPEGHTLISAEYREGNYQRSFILPDGLDGDHIQASYRDGVLQLKVPKTEPPPAKKISVTAS